MYFSPLTRMKHIIAVILFIGMISLCELSCTLSANPIISSGSSTLQDESSDFDPKFKPIQDDNLSLHHLRRIRKRINIGDNLPYLDLSPNTPSDDVIDTNTPDSTQQPENVSSNAPHTEAPNDTPPSTIDEYPINLDDNSQVINPTQPDDINQPSLPPRRRRRRLLALLDRNSNESIHNPDQPTIESARDNELVSSHEHNSSPLSFEEIRQQHQKRVTTYTYDILDGLYYEFPYEGIGKRQEPDLTRPRTNKKYAWAGRRRLHRPVH